MLHEEVKYFFARRVKKVYEAYGDLMVKLKMTAPGYLVASLDKLQHVIKMINSVNHFLGVTLLKGQ